MYRIDERQMYHIGLSEKNKCTIQNNSIIYSYRLFGLSCLDLSRLVSAYFLSQNTIYSTNPTLFMRSVEQALIESIQRY